MKPQKLAIEEFVEGDKWDGIPAIIISKNGLPPANTLSSVTMRFAKQGTEGTSVVELSSTNPAQILIQDPNTWEVSIPEQVLPLTVGKWDWQFRTVDDQGNPETFIGDTITILRKI